LTIESKKRTNGWLNTEGFLNPQCSGWRWPLYKPFAAIPVRFSVLYNSGSMHQ